ncbi:MAG: hypothetical protein IT379_18405, partial [Deltaproteobacteria bacterium]|nr:hypothetical protein [Deltaproteobacteria bacterium]
MPRAHRSVLVAFLLGVGGSACSLAPADEHGARREVATRDAGTRPLPDPLLPPSPGPWAPSFARVAEGGQLDWEWLNDTQTCQGCHQDAAAHWRSSVHAFSS